jgi:hypothetical protein
MRCCLQRQLSDSLRIGIGNDYYATVGFQEHKPATG